MADTREENTRWISVWIINDPDYYDLAQEYARLSRESGNYSILRYYLSEVLAARATDAVKATAREMSEADMDTVDWEEVANDLLPE